MGGLDDNKIDILLGKCGFAFFSTLVQSFPINTECVLWVRGKVVAVFFRKETAMR